MRIAILSDIHSNKYAFLKAIELIDQNKIDKLIFLGDFFGYYPWASETFELLNKLPSDSLSILGNHDIMIRDTDNLPSPLPEYYPVILQNRAELSFKGIDWLNCLNPIKEVNLSNYKFKLFHGTPDDPINGRFYPDNDNQYDWFPKKNELVLMGHTHYPLAFKCLSGGWIINPGSVGQPRKKGSKPSFCIIDLDDFKVEFIEFSYDVQSAIAELESVNWYPRAIESLKRSISN